MRTLPPAPATVRRHVVATATLAAPIALSMLSQMAMGLTDTVMLGRIGDRALAAGGLGASVFFTVGYALQGVVSGVAVLAARALGAGKPGEVSRAYASGLALAIALSVPFFLLISAPAPLLRALGEPPALAADAAAYLRVLRWGVPAALIGIGVVRTVLPAIGLQLLLAGVLPAAVAVNAGLNLWLIRGGLGIPALGLRGSAAATAISLWLVALVLMAILHGHWRWRRFVTPLRIDRQTLRALLAIGVPTGGMVLVEAALFLVTGLLMGRLGARVLAAHMVALSVASFTFMVPWSIGQAANVRVAAAAGAGHGKAVRLAGFSAIGMAAAFMLFAAALLLALPRPIVALYLSRGGEPATAALAVRLLGIAALFQVADGLQATAAGALRGLGDTRVPMLLAGLGYWGIGFPLGCALAFAAGLGAVGLWCGLLAGLAATAAALTCRFAALTRKPARASTGSERIDYTLE